MRSLRTLLAGTLACFLIFLLVLILRVLFAPGNWAAR